LEFNKPAAIKKLTVLLLFLVLDSQINKFLPMQPTNSKIFITENHPFKFSSPNSNDQDKKTWGVHTWPQKQEENG
jgi:hypothetical protein